MSKRLVICPFGFELSPSGVLVAPYGVIVMSAEENEQDAPSVSAAPAAGPGIARALPSNVYRLPARRTA